MTETNQLNNWQPVLGYVLCKPLKREELNRQSDKDDLELADGTGKVSDSVGVGRVIQLGPDSIVDNKLMGAATFGVRVGDLIAHMPYVDKLIEVDGEKFSLVAYKQIMGIMKAEK
jgi:co-chaperonin GroES (HSP10)